jgi:hypothetical protein
MSVMILYRHPAHPNEAGISYAPDEAYARVLKDRLARRGFQIVKIAPTLVMAISGRGHNEPPASD